MTTADTDDGAILDAALAAAGLAPSPSEREALLELYALFKPGVAALHALPQARYESPAAVFQAAPKLTPWGLP